MYKYTQKSITESSLTGFLICVHTCYSITVARVELNSLQLRLATRFSLIHKLQFPEERGI